MTFNYRGNDTDFKDIFFQYLTEVEGYKNVVYNDIYGNPTVGLGHEIELGDNLVKGDVVSDDDVLNFFKKDYDRLNIESYIREAADNYNQALAIGHFIWGHGDGEYKNSQLRQHMINKDLDYNGLIAYLNSNWDVNKPKNQKVNTRDFTIYYSANPWQPSMGLSYYYDKITNFISTNAASNPVMTYGASALVVMGILAIGVGIYRKIVNKK